MCVFVYINYAKCFFKILKLKQLLETNIITELLSLSMFQFLSFIMNRLFNHLTCKSLIFIICNIIISICTIQKELLESPIFELTLNCTFCTCFLKYLGLFSLKLSMYILNHTGKMSLFAIIILLHFLMLLYVLKLFNFKL